MKNPKKLLEDPQLMYSNRRRDPTYAGKQTRIFASLPCESLQGTVIDRTSAGNFATPPTMGPTGTCWILKQRQTYSTRTVSAKRWYMENADFHSDLADQPAD